MFGSYGSGQATISNAGGAVWLPPGTNNLTFDGLVLTTGNQNNHTVFADSGNAPGSSNIIIRNSLIENSAGSGIDSWQPTDSGWTIDHNTITHIGDSAIISLGNGTVISNNTISDIGWNNSISWAKHGVYAKGPNQTIDGNDFSNIPNGQAVSIRFHGAHVYDNTIHDTPYAFAFFDYDTAAAPQGTSYIYDNRSWNISGYGFYYNSQADPQGHAPTVSFVVASNTFAISNGGEGVNLSEVPNGATAQLANNIFSGTINSGYRGCPTCTETHNDWSGATSNIPHGSGDITTPPQLSPAPALAPATTSPVTNAGTTTVPGITYTPACDGQPLHYCGSAPDIGAVQAVEPKAAPSSLGRVTSPRG